MSMMAMAEAKVVDQIRAAPSSAPPATTPPTGRGANGGGAAIPSPVGVPANVVNQLLTWIPTESITIYVAYIALFDPVTPQADLAVCQNDFTPRWIGFWTFSVVTSLIALGGYIGKRRAATPVPPFKWPIFAMVVAPIAFTTWAAALPDTPFRDFCGYSSAIGGFAVLLSAVGISFIAWMLGKGPDYVKT